MSLAPRGNWAWFSRFAKGISISLLALAVIPVFAGQPVFSGEVVGQASSTAPVRLIGTIKSIEGNTVILATQSGTESTLQIEDGTRMLRIEPGQKDLKSATPIQLRDLQVGDRVLVRGTPSAGSLVASSVIVMKQTDIAHEHQLEEEAWQHGVGGLVSSVDPAAQTVTISTMSLGAVKKVIIHTSRDAILRRYAPDSVRFSDAKPGTFSEIKSGDQLRARGRASADGAEFTADEIVSGAFQNIAGTIVAANPDTGEIRVLDLVTKKPVTVKVTAETQLRKLPAMMAQGLAMRLKGGNGAPEDASAGNGGRPAGSATQGPAPGRRFGNQNGGGMPDLQEILSRLPAVKLADLAKGEAVMIVATEAGASEAPKAIKLLSGVEPLLTASPKGGESTILSAWSLSAPSGGESEAQ